MQLAELILLQQKLTPNGPEAQLQWKHSQYLIYK